MTRVCMGMMMMMMIKMVLFSGMFMSGLAFDMQLVKVHPKQAISGVSEASIGNQYALNASSARDLCEHLGLTIANKAQLAEAQKHGLETCRFGWIDEQIAVVPRVKVNPNCGNGKTGVVVWRAVPSKLFDVFCFNVTDFETQASIKMHQMTTGKPMTTRSSVAPTAGVHLRGSPLSKLPSHWSSVPRSASAGPSVIHRADAKHLALSSGSTEAVPAALLITVTFAVMIAVFLALYYVRTKRPCKAQCDVEQQKEYIETEVWEHHTKEDLQKTQEEQVEDKNQEEQMEEKNQEELDENHQEEQMEERRQEEHMKKNQEEQVEENDSSSAEQ